MYRKIWTFSEMIVSGIRDSLLGLGCLNTILALVFALYGWNARKFHLDCKLILENLFKEGFFQQKTTMKRPRFFSSNQQK